MIKIRELQVKALMDTGAQITAITKDLFNELRDKKIEITVVPIAKFPVIRAFSERGEVVAKKVAIDFTIGSKQFTGDFHIMKKLPHRVILGLDFLSAHNARIGYGEDGMKETGRN